MKKYERPFLVTTIPAVEGNACGAEIYDLVTSEVGKKKRKKWCVCQGGGAAGGIDWEVEASRCKLLYTGWINNKVLLYTTGNSIQYPVINHKISLHTLWKWKSLSRVQLFATPWTIYSPWNSPGFRTQGLNPGIEPKSPALQVDSLPAEPQGKPKNTRVGSLSLLQGIFPTHKSKWGLLHFRWILYQLSYQGSPCNTL